ncbi:MAG: tRNA (adenosine(37)-N6)-threonylcarbamoyltransferase complex dimerization subunit type 1 TsaB [Polaromonas sp.]|nr:MAG: tRNA (adenosine(37)-N6)-threonylcarbamoyltransferase complex dimerization subunit type 1 TsaB [Polaromonas sp.]
MKFLAFDTSTHVMSIAVTDGERVWQHTGPGGAKSSATLIPAILALLTQARLTLGALDAIVFGRGPGSFTGLRTACAVAQGLALGAGVRVLPVDTLMALAEEARSTHASDWPAHAPLCVTALLDARMDEMYVQSYEFSHGTCKAVDGCRLIRPENLWLDSPLDVARGNGLLLAGNVFDVYCDRLPSAAAHLTCAPALPTATALLRLAPALAAAGQCVDAALALPLYVRDKVALTTQERDQAKRAKTQAALAGPASASHTPE